MSSKCSHSIRFGFSYGSTLQITVPGNSENLLLRVYDEVSIVREPRSSNFQAFDTCTDSITNSTSSSSVTFHSIRIGSGICPGFDSAVLIGKCMQTEWFEHMSFIDAQFKTEDEEYVKSGDIRYVGLFIPDISLVTI